MINLWKTEYLLNLDEIDSQHQHFFAMCTEIVQMAETVTLEKSSIRNIIRALGSLRTYAFLHFKTEEDIMLKFGFPGYLDHAGYHNGYLQKMMEFETGFKALLSELGKSEHDEAMLKTFLKDVSGFVADWWGDHIVNQDAKYATHIKDKKKSSLG